MTNSDFNNKALYLCNWNRVCVYVWVYVWVVGVFVGRGKFTLAETDKNTQICRAVKHKHIILSDHEYE